MPSARVALAAVAAPREAPLTMLTKPGNCEGEPPSPSPVTDVTDVVCSTSAPRAFASVVRHVNPTFNAQQPLFPSFLLTLQTFVFVMLHQAVPNNFLLGGPVMDFHPSSTRMEASHKSPSPSQLALTTTRVESYYKNPSPSQHSFDHDPTGILPRGCVPLFDFSPAFSRGSSLQETVLLTKLISKNVQQNNIDLFRFWDEFSLTNEDYDNMLGMYASLPLTIAGLQSPPGSGSTQDAVPLRMR
eukprot:738819-Prorocentrum_minimum.AAC.1